MALPDRPEEREEDFRPWEKPGAVRRDCEPHRGLLLKSLTGCSLVCGGLAFVFFLPGFLGLTFGIVTVILARRDVQMMEKGRMHSSGWDATWDGRIWGQIGIILNISGLIACGLLMLSTRTM